MDAKQHSWKKVHIDQESRQPIDRLHADVRRDGGAPATTCVEGLLGTLRVIVTGRKGGVAIAKKVFTIPPGKWHPQNYGGGS